jgi:hypothetical protein
MPFAIQTIAGFFTAVGAATSPATPAAGDSFAVAAYTSGKAYLEQVYASGAQVDFVRIRSPRMHDANQGLRLWTGTTLRQPLIPWEIDQSLYPADVPIVEIDATGAGTNGVLLHYVYDDMPGAMPRLASPAEVLPRIVNVSGVEVDVTSGALGQWGASAAINSLFDNFEAGADYALLGYTCSAACLGISITGKDTGNLKIGGPGDANAFDTRDYFIKWSEYSGKSCIPIIAANNKGSTVLQNVDIAAATVVKVSLIMAQLA